MSHAAAGLPPAPEDCRGCGACCLSHEASYIRVFEADWRRMGAPARALTEPDRDQGRAMRFVDGRCSALLVNSPAGTLTCGIYTERPDACRWLERASRACREQIRDKRVRALALLQP